VFESEGKIREGILDFSAKLNELSTMVAQRKGAIKTEEATKTAFVLPFISKVLGYDIFDPDEVVPEYICDVGTKKGEKIDYAIMRDGIVQMLFECKKVGEDLNINHASQLFRYFHVTNARIGILTNGQRYKFFTDLDNKNKMDEKPFLELDLLEIDENIISEVNKLTKGAFDVESIVNAAGELKYIGQIKKIIVSQFTSPDDEFVRFFSQRVYDGVNTQKVRELFSSLTKKALAQFLNDQTNDRLKSAISGSIAPMESDIVMEKSAILMPSSKDEDGIDTTQEEMDGYYIVKAIARNAIESKRIYHRDTKSYFGVLVDDNNRKPLCRLNFNGNKKYITIFDENKSETRHELESLDDIYNFSDQITSTAKQYS
jgi:predicted type IV restriction endonuclease